MSGAMGGLRRFSPVLFAALILAGCDTFLGGSEGPPLPGERISVLNLDQTLVADPTLADLRVRLPQPRMNQDWPQAGGYPSHAMHHLALPDNLEIAWTADIGTSRSSDRLLLSGPVVADGRIYTIDASTTVTAFNAQDGEQIWRVDLTPEEEDDGLFGGGIAVDDGRLYVTTPFALVFALDAETGDEIWQAELPGPSRAAPAVAGGRVFAVTIDNQLAALDADDGSRLWSHAGISEAAGLLGGTTPAVAGDTVIAAYSSGELYALRAETGNVQWTENLAGIQRTDTISSLAHIRGRPVIDRDLVFAVSNSGTLAAIDLRRGGRAWDVEIGGTQQPYVAGDFVYVLSNNAELVALTRREGRVRWVQSLPQFVDPEERDEPIYWSGPLLAGDRLIVTGSNSEALSISPYTGEILGQIDIPGSHLPAIAAGGSLYLLADNATLIALR